LSRLNLHCELCGRRQANGLLSGAAWGRVELGPDVILRACPTCKTMHSDWENRLRATLDGMVRGVEKPGRLGA
jgi:hypothetical protein